MKVQYIQENKVDKVGNKLKIAFAGGYISNIVKYEPPEEEYRTYISVDIKVCDTSTDEKETIRLMVFKKFYKSDNPNVKLLIDAFEKQVPVAVVFYHGPLGNVFQCCYTNFSTSKSASGGFIELIDEALEDLPF